MAADFFAKEIQFLPGMGTKRAQLLADELEIRTVGDLLRYYPYRHIDRTQSSPVCDVSAEDSFVQLRGTIRSLKQIGEGPKSRYSAIFADKTGSVELVWFRGGKWLTDSVVPGKEYIVYGKPSSFNGQINFSHPEIEPVAEAEKKLNQSPYSPLYITTEKMKRAAANAKLLQTLMRTVCTQLQAEFVQETLPAEVSKEHDLMHRKESLIAVHFPANIEELDEAQRRVKFEELFFVQLHLLRQREQTKERNAGAVFGSIGTLFNRCYRECLPFDLTDAQKRVLREIRKDVGNGRQMNRLVQGDVGSGKTIVALLSMLMAADNGYQACLMAPTEILANQHFASISELLAPLPVKVRLLTGSSRVRERAEIAAGLEDGTIDILIGTHALIEETVRFRSLGLAVIDEQHRFGVAQRSRLWAKGTPPPHVLVMTATPIPRTLAMTVYGDLDISVIDQLPPGRKPIKTSHYMDSARLKVLGFMKQQVDAGRQVYVVFPLIKESEVLDFKHLEDGYEAMVRYFEPPAYQVCVVHGKMKAADKDFAMKQFIEKKAHIMVATTVIEVGVNVPNATVMVIESAERFGLSQLHQLRGRVGRGGDQSYCILMTDVKLSKETRHRMQIMTGTNDGFAIAEADLRMRGPGDLDGTAQSGLGFDLRMASLSKDGDLLEAARETASRIIAADPQLELPQHEVLARALKHQFGKRVEWRSIS